MRSLISKVLTGSMIAGAALMVSACGPTTQTTTDNTIVTDLNATDSMDTMSDNMTAIDGAMGDNGAMANDTMMTSNTTTTTTNAM